MYFVFAFGVMQFMLKWEIKSPHEQVQSVYLFVWINDAVWLRVIP